jgi:hypothetical protein
VCTERVQVNRESTFFAERILWGNFFIVNKGEQT